MGWLRDCLTGRRQKVLCEGKLSNECVVESGVPQGTVLGPPLFNIFIDDIDSEASLINLLLKFADNTKGMKQKRNESDKHDLQKTLDGSVGMVNKMGHEVQCRKMHVGTL